IEAAAKRALLCFLHGGAQGLAHLAGHQLAEDILVALQDLGRAPHHAGPFGERHITPGTKALGSEADLLLQNLVGMLGKRAQQLAGKRVDARHSALGQLDYFLRAHDLSRFRGYYNWMPAWRRRGLVSKYYRPR